MAKRGRPSTYTKAIAERICQRLANGETLRAICRGEDFPIESTVRRWVIDDRNGFYAQYVRARDIGMDAMVDEMIDIADYTKDDTKTTDGGDVPNTEWISRSKLRIDTRKWYVSKIAPKRYGEKLLQDESPNEEIQEDYQLPLTPDEPIPDETVV